MFDPWEPATPYSPGALVSYNGLEYFRSNFPLTQTMGTPPNQEMSTDPQGTPIRTWSLWGVQPEAYNPKRNRLVPRYFRLVEENPQTTPNTYQGMTDFQQSAYDNEFNNPSQFDLDLTRGYALEMDQDGAGFLPVPQDKCGVCLQQWQEIGDPKVIFPERGVGAALFYRINLILVNGKWVPDSNAQKPYIYYVFLIFNHPLYFRRSFELSYRYSNRLGIEFEVTHTYTPTDDNYGRAGGNTYIFPNNGTETYFQPSNAAWTFQLATEYDNLVSIWIKEIESND